MKKYVIMALLPIIFQGAVYGADLNAILMTELQNARKISHYSGPLKFDPVLETLVSFSQKGKVVVVVCVVPNTQQQPFTFVSMHLTLITILSYF